MSKVQTNQTVRNKYNIANSRYITNRQLKQKNATLEGVVVNNFIKDNNRDGLTSLNDTYNTLVISDNESQSIDKFLLSNSKTDKDYDTKKAMIPLVAGTASVFMLSAILSLLFKKSAQKNLTQPFIKQLPAMGMNLNIVEETGFSTYMALRDPSRQNILAAISVFVFSALTLTAKKFIEGSKEIWIKKQDADIQRDLQENLIDVETRAFSGKLAIQRNILSQKGNYFKNALVSQNNQQATELPCYKDFNFKGDNNNQSKNKKSWKEYFNPHFVISSLFLVAAALLGIFTFKNIKSGAKHQEEFIQNFRSKKQDILDNIIRTQSKDKATFVDTLIKMGATSEKARECAQRAGFSTDDINEIVSSVENGVENIWGNAPTGMSTESGKSFFYCYLNEARGHLYNWLIHSDNPYLKDLFIAMTAISATSFVAQQAAEAMKDAAVLRENAKTELELQKRLVEVEINNFKAKKESAIAPLIDEFERKRKEGKPPEELKVMADNILLEIKNGPPFVYS